MRPVSHSGSASLSLAGLTPGSYEIRARIIDPAGNTDISNVVSVQAPQADSVALTVPATITATNYQANVQVTAGAGNGFANTLYVDLAQNNGAFVQFASTALSSMGAAVLPLSGLTAGTYQIRARTTDLYGTTVVSPTQTITIATPAVSMAPIPSRSAASRRSPSRPAMSMP